MTKPPLAGGQPLRPGPSNQQLNGYKGYNAYITNAYTTTNIRLTPTNSSDKLFSAPFAYQSGPLGAYYQLTNSGLANVGTTNATNVTLYHYTVTTNPSGATGWQIKETNSVVDIGYHYVATDQYGNPMDTDGDGLPDYLRTPMATGFMTAAT